MTPIVATYLVRVTLREPTWAEEHEASQAPSNGDLETIIRDALEIELQLEAKVASERTDQ